MTHLSTRELRTQLENGKERRIGMATVTVYGNGCIFFYIFNSGFLNRTRTVKWRAEIFDGMVRYTAENGVQHHKIKKKKS
jgi:hypothetical protein